MSTYLYQGTGTALATPFNLDGSIDFDSLARLIDTQLNAEIEALIPCGSTGESATMSEEERMEVIRFTVVHSRSGAEKRGIARPRIIAGTASNVTSGTIDFTARAATLGIDAALISTPYYNKPTQSGLLAHFGAIADAITDLPIVLYNVPGRTASNMTAETTVELAKRYKNIVGIKEASGDLDQCSAIIGNAPEGFALYSGEDSLTLPLMAIGARGVIAVVSNEVPHEFSTMVRLGLAGNFDQARTIHLNLFDLMRLNFIESNPVPVKEALCMMGIFTTPNVRLPLVPLTDDHRETLRRGVQRFTTTRVGM